MKKLPRYDIFLSYRRDGGDMTALYLYERLTHMGYRVAYDFETLLNGRWDDAILRTIEGCQDVVVVLSPGALDRCVEWEKNRAIWINDNPGRDFLDKYDKNDWMRREIAHANLHKKNILPVLLRDFSFPPVEQLPEDIRELPFQNGIGASPEHHRDTLTRLTKRLTAKPVWYRLPFALLGTVSAIAVAAASFAITALSVFSRNPAPKVFPSTRAEEQTVSEVLRVVGNLATAYQCAAEARLKYVEEAFNSLGDPSVAASGALFLRKQLNDALDLLEKARPTEGAIAKLNDTPLDIAVYRALFDASRQEIAEDLKALPVTIPFYTSKDNPLPDKDRKGCLQKNKTWMELQSQHFALGVIELLQPVSPDALAEFKKHAATYTAIPRLAQTWPPDKESLDIEQEAVMQRLQTIVTQLASVVGNENMDYSADRQKNQNTLREAGVTPEKITEIIGHIETDAAKKTYDKWTRTPSD